MRVLYVNCSRHLSGADLSQAALIRALGGSVEPYILMHWRMDMADQLPVDVAHLYREYSMPYLLTTRAAGYYSARQIAGHTAKLVTPLATLALLKARWGLDLVHINDTPAVAYAWAASLLGLGVVVHARATVDQLRFGARLLGLLARRPRTAFIAIDDEVLHSLPSHCRAAATVIYNPIEMSCPDSPDAARSRMRRAWGVPDDCILVGQVASLYRYKGVFRVLELAERVCTTFPNTHFVLVGSDPTPDGQGTALRQAAHRKGLQDRFHVGGFERDRPTVYASLDIALCMFGEGLGGVGRTAFEAALSGKAVLATLPGHATSRTFIHERGGLVYEPDDRQGQTEGLGRLVASEHARLALGRRAKAWIGRRHDPAQVAHQVANLYGQLTGDSDSKGLPNPASKG